MSEQDDKAFHNWVRRSLDRYRPGNEPTNWIQLQATLRRRRWWRRTVLMSGSLFLLLFFGWLLLPGTTNHPSNVVTVTTKTRLLPIVDSASLPDKFVYVPVIPKFEAGKPATYIQKTGLTSRPAVSERLLVQTPAHGLVPMPIRLLSAQVNEQIRSRQTVAFSPEETAITQQMLTGQFGSDSTAYLALNRNIRQWPDAVIVCDLTTSMYPYTTQLFAWFAKNAQNPAIKGMVFFTDCDSLGQQTRPGGPPGRMYVTRDQSTTSAVPLLVEAARNTVRNIDDAENDVEALLMAQRQFPEAKHLILLADNLSQVKDMALLAQVKKPVHIVLCGTTGSDTTLAFQPDFYSIASQTNGSIHTRADDLFPNGITSKTTLQVGSRYYRYSARRKAFKLTPFDHRPRHFLSILWH